MSEFSDRPFVAGELVGLRSFKIDSLGRLTGVIRQSVFAPGENEAKCSGYAMGGMVWGPGSTITVAGGTYRIEPNQSLGLAERPKHPVGSLNCACGYYAYLDAKHNPHHAEGQILAVIRGYGTCTVGSRGFRASKAELVAFVVPRAASLRKPYWKFNAAIAAVISMFLVFAVLSGTWWAVAVDATCVAANVGLAIFNFNQRKPRLDIGLLTRNYPGVPVYKSTKAALAAHPLTEPEPVTPETADDFWTRSAS